MKSLRARHYDYNAVVNRISKIQVLCGDWSRCVTPAKLYIGERCCSCVGVFLDPPYGEGSGVEYEDRDGKVAADVWEWAVANGDNPRLRIVVAGYDDGRVLPEGWTTIERAEKGGYGNMGENKNRHRERLWCSPHCLNSDSNSLFF